MTDAAALSIAEVIARVRAAIGGDEAIAATRCHEQRCVVSGAESQIQVQLLDEPTGRLRADVEVPSLGIRVLRGYDGVQAWEVSPMFDGWYGSSHPITRELAGHPRPLWLASVADGEAAPRLAAPARDAEGRPCLVVERTFRNQADQPVPERTYVDLDAFLVREIHTGHGSERVTLLQDYREHAGRLWPWRTTTRLEHGTIVETVEEIRILGPRDEMFAHPSRPRPEASAVHESPDAASLETIWETIANVYFDVTFGGVDWAAVRERYLPQALALPAPPGGRAFVELATEMISELRATHFKVIPRDHVRTGEARDRAPGLVGLEVRWVDDRAVVWRCEPGTPAALSPLVRGFAVTAVNGRDDAALRDRHDAAIGHTPNEGLRAQLRYALELQCFAGDEVTVDYLDGQELPATAKLVAIPRPAQIDPHFAARREGADVLVVAFDIFFGDVAASFRRALDENPDARALVIDLRGNPGGSAVIPGRIAGCLAPSGSLGRMLYRKESATFEIVASDPIFNGPVAFLVDSGSGSCSELLAGSLQEMGRARVFGRRTAGAVLPSTMTLLPNGCQFQYAICDYVTPGGRRLEGEGVIPDEAIALHRAELLAGRDADLEAALAWIRAGG